MIDFRKEDLHDAEGMRRAYAYYEEQIHAHYADTFNGMLNAHLVTCDYNGHTATFAMDGKPWMANPNGVLHGGVTASFLDFTMGVVSRYYSGGHITPTIQMNVNYLRPVPIKGPIYCRATVRLNGLHICGVTAELWTGNDSQSLCATAEGSYYVQRGHS